SANPDPLTDAKGTPYTAYDGSTNTQANAARSIAIGQGAKSNAQSRVAYGLWYRDFMSSIPTSY
ncbi:Hemagglutinin superfamily, partial [human gut metagenome]